MRILLFGAFLSIFFLIDSTSAMLFYMQAGKRLQGTEILKTISNVDHVWCLGHCLHMEGCNSFNFQKGKLKGRGAYCEFFPRNRCSTHATLVSDPKMDYFDALPECTIGLLVLPKVLFFRLSLNVLVYWFTKISDYFIFGHFLFSDNF